MELQGQMPNPAHGKEELQQGCRLGMEGLREQLCRKGPGGARRQPGAQWAVPSLLWEIQL